MGLLADIKKSMRITHDALDTTLQIDIDTSAADMYRVGIQPYQTDEDGEIIVVAGEKQMLDEPLINKAAELYCKWQEDYQGKGDKYNKDYNNLRDAMSKCSDYQRTEVPDAE